MPPRSILIKNGQLLTMDRATAGLGAGDILVTDGRIAEIAPKIACDDAEVVDAAGMIVMPGFVDTHRHVWQTQLKGVASDWSLYDYLTWIRTMYSVCYVPQDAYLGNYAGALEAINAGITTIVDHSHLQMSPDHSDALAQGLLDSGIRGVFCYGAYRNPTYKPGEHIDQAALMTELFSGLSDFHRTNAERVRDRFFPSQDGRVQFGIASSEFCSFRDLAPVLEEVEWANQLEAWRISSHAGIGFTDELQFVEPLAKAGLLNERMLFVHGAHLTDREVALIVEHGASISSTPETELQMGMGYPVAERLQAAGGHANLGIDIVSNFAGDMFAQMRLMLQTWRFRDYERGGHQLPATPRYPAASMLEIATLGGARAIGLEDRIGSLTVGKEADIITIRTDAISMAPVTDPVAAAMFYAHATDVNDVMVGGKFLKRDGKLTEADWTQLSAQMRTSCDDIMQRVRTIPLDQVLNAWASLYAD